MSDRNPSYEDVQRQGGRVCGANRWGTAPKRKSLACSNKTRVGCSGSDNLSAVLTPICGRQAYVTRDQPAGGRNCSAVTDWWSVPHGPPALQSHLLDFQADDFRSQKQIGGPFAASPFRDAPRSWLDRSIERVK
jgi:hypothetical protein